MLAKVSFSNEHDSQKQKYQRAWSAPLPELPRPTLKYFVMNLGAISPIVLLFHHCLINFRPSKSASIQVVQNGLLCVSLFSLSRPVYLLSRTETVKIVQYSASYKLVPVHKCICTRDNIKQQWYANAMCVRERLL